MLLVIKSALFTVLIPGTVTGLIPYLILSSSPARTTLADKWGIPHELGLLLMLCGAGILLRCIWEFGVSGRGTLAPIDPPKKLVVQGLYRYVRNPMYLGVFVLLWGEVWFFQSPALLRYTIGTMIFIHFFVLFYEEPTLRRRFGDDYMAYCRSVRRWWPGKPF